MFCSEVSELHPELEQTSVFPPGEADGSARRARTMKRPCEDSSSADSDVEETIDVGSESVYPG